MYDLAQNTGWVSVGVDHDTAKFSTATIGRWWEKMGKLCYPKASKLLITADGGGSNGSRLRLWKFELQELADRTGLSITVCHFPPGTSKWNKIEHRLFSFLAKNWRGRPLLTLATIVNLIAATRTEKGLRVECELDCGSYPWGPPSATNKWPKSIAFPTRFTANGITQSTRVQSMLLARQQLLLFFDGPLRLEDRVNGYQTKNPRTAHGEVCFNRMNRIFDRPSTQR